MAELKKVDIDDILYIDDRKVGGRGNIKALSLSIKSVGLLTPILIKKVNSDKKPYKIIAGRRRLKAVELLGENQISSIIYDETEEIPKGVNDELIALTENIFRLGLHPLDEGEQYQKLIKDGFSIEELETYFDKSKSHIYKRIQLQKIDEGLKTLFKEGKINLSMASKLSNLPLKTQTQIFKELEKGMDEYETYEDWELQSIARRFLKMPLVFNCKKCEKCKKRTFYSNNELFPELKNERDYCFNIDCYNDTYRKHLEDAFYKSDNFTLPQESKNQENKKVNKTIYLDIDFFSNYPEQFEKFKTNVNDQLSKYSLEKNDFLIFNENLDYMGSTYGILKNYFDGVELKELLHPVLNDSFNLVGYVVPPQMREKLNKFEDECEATENKARFTDEELMIVEPLPENIQKEIFKDCNFGLLGYSENKKISLEFFKDILSLEQINTPNSILEIANCALKDCMYVDCFITAYSIAMNKTVNLSNNSEILDLLKEDILNNQMDFLVVEKIIILYEILKMLICNYVNRSLERVDDMVKLFKKDGCEIFSAEELKNEYYKRVREHLRHTYKAESPEQNNNENSSENKDAELSEDDNSFREEQNQQTIDVIDVIDAEYISFF